MDWGWGGRLKFHFHSTKLHKIEEIPIAHMQKKGKRRRGGGGKERQTRERVGGEGK